MTYEYISKQRAKDLMGCCLASAKAQYKAEKNEFKKARYGDYISTIQPVKHGRWIEVTPKHSKCSCCDVTCLIAVYPISANANFCPNCGADMR